MEDDEEFVVSRIEKKPAPVQAENRFDGGNSRSKPNYDSEEKPYRAFKEEGNNFNGRMRGHQARGGRGGRGGQERESYGGGDNHREETHQQPGGGRGMRRDFRNNGGQNEGGNTIRGGMMRNRDNHMGGGRGKRVSEDAGNQGIMTGGRGQREGGRRDGGQRDRGQRDHQRGGGNMRGGYNRGDTHRQPMGQRSYNGYGENQNDRQERTRKITQVEEMAPSNEEEENWKKFCQLEEEGSRAHLQQSPLKIRSERSNSSERMKAAAPNNTAKAREGSSQVYRYNPEQRKLLTCNNDKGDVDDVVAHKIDSYMTYREHQEALKAKE